MPRASGGTERLVGAAAELLERGGYAEASVGAITSGAGVTPGALYRHFSSKAELIVAVLREAARVQAEAMWSAADAEEDVLGKLDAVVATYARRALARPRLAWALVYEPVDPSVDAERLAYRRAFSAGMADLIRRGVATGAFPPQDAELVAAAIVGVISETLAGPLSPVQRDDADHDETIAAIVALCRRLATGGG
jgi:AcrR family transcriptional regulator